MPKLAGLLLILLIGAVILAPVVMASASGVAP